MGTEIEVFVEGVRLRDMVNVRRAVGTVGRSVEAGVGALQVPEPVSEWRRKQGDLYSLLQAYAEPREKFRKGKLASSDSSPGG
jgi:hypothetical protein